LLKEKSLHLIDVGTSGGIWGLREGYSLMFGGEPEVVHRLRPIFETLAPAPDQGWGHVGPAGAGHFVKMVHNGIEYGLMQAYAEGFAILKAKKEFGMDLHAISRIWQHGSDLESSGGSPEGVPRGREYIRYRPSGQGNRWGGTVPENPRRFP